MRRKLNNKNHSRRTFGAERSPLNFDPCRHDGLALPIRATGGGDGGNGIDFHHVIGTGWIHTHGMAERGFPELEVRHVPDFLAEPAASLLKHVCDYMLDTCTRIKPGEVMETSPRTRFRMIKGEPLSGEENHYTAERLLLVDVEHTCECCGGKSSESI